MIYIVFNKWGEAVYEGEDWDCAVEAWQENGGYIAVRYVDV